jgi:acetyltransferase-like isoleucine patch superfamily enzyme
MEQHLVISDKKKIMKIIDNTTLIQDHISSYLRGKVNFNLIKIRYMSNIKIGVHFKYTMNVVIIDNDETLICLLNGTINKNKDLNGMRVHQIHWVTYICNSY